MSEGQLAPRLRRGTDVADFIPEQIQRGKRRLALLDALGDGRCTDITDWIVTQIHRGQRLTLLDGLSAMSLAPKAHIVLSPKFTAVND